MRPKPVVPPVSPAESAPAPYFWLQGIVGWGALLTATVVLTKQNRLAKLADWCSLILDHALYAGVQSVRESDYYNGRSLQVYTLYGGTDREFSHAINSAIGNELPCNVPYVRRVSKSMPELLFRCMVSARQSYIAGIEAV